MTYYGDFLVKNAIIFIKNDFYIFFTKKLENLLKLCYYTNI